MTAYANATIALEDLSQTDGDVVQNLIGEANYFQLSFVPSTSATGTVSIMTQTVPQDDFSPLRSIETRAPEIVDLASTDNPVIIDGYKLRAIRFDPTSVVGSYSVYIQQENR